MKSKSEKGITLMVLTITIIILLIITSITINNFYSQLSIKKLNNLYSDIESISNKVMEYYLGQDTLPVNNIPYMSNKSDFKNLLIQNGAEDNVLNPNDGDNYYVIDLSKIDNLTLNYGQEYKEWKNDSEPNYTKYQNLYVINDVTHQIYYPQGIVCNKDKYFSENTDIEMVDSVDKIAVDESKFKIEDINSFTEGTTAYEKTDETIIATSNLKLTIDKDIYALNSLAYAWSDTPIDEDNRENLLLSKFSLNSDNDTTLVSKALNGSKEKYYLYIKALDINGEEHWITEEIEKTSKKIEDVAPENYYGDIIDYDIDLGNNPDGELINIIGTADYDWEIFYKDDTNLYIISEDYVPIENSLMPTGIYNTISTTEPYSLYWSNSDIVNTIDNSKLAISTNIADKYLSNWKEKNSTKYNSNAKMTAILMDTEIWSNFANSKKVNDLTLKKDELIANGGSTLEMWVKSWNQKYGDSSDYTKKEQLYYEANETGYYLGTLPNPSLALNYYAQCNEMTGYSDKLYYPHVDGYNNCFGYWLASPSAYNDDYMMYVDRDGNIKYNMFNNTYEGIRPIVCLPSDITAQWNEKDQIWNIVKK